MYREQDRREREKEDQMGRATGNHAPGLLNGRGGRFRLQADFAESGFVLADILIENVRQRLGLLRTQENALVVVNGDAIRRVLIDGAEEQEKIPQTDPHLDAVGVGFPIVGCVGQMYFGRRGLWVHAFSAYRFLTVAAGPEPREYPHPVRKS